MTVTMKATTSAANPSALREARLLPRYAELTALSDLGLSPNQIADYLGSDPARVRALLAYYGLEECGIVE